MKRILIVLLAAVLLSLAACGGDGSDTTAPKTDPPTTASTAPTTQPIRYVTVTLEPSGGACDVQTLSVAEGECYGPLPEAALEGFVFLGWFTEPEAGTAVTSDTPLVSNAPHTLYAHWEVQTQFTLTLEPNGGRISPYHSQIEVTVDEAYGSLPEPIREGYIFQGWYTAPEGGTRIGSTTKFTDREQRVLYAQWEYDAYAYWSYVLENRVETIPQCRRVVVYLERNAGTKTYLTSDFLNDAGALNAAEGLEDIQVTDEWITSMNPHILIKLCRDIDMGLVYKIGMIRRFGNAEIYIFPTSVNTGSENAQLYYRLQLAMILYPEYFEDVDLKTVAAELEIKPRIYY